MLSFEAVEVFEGGSLKICGCKSERVLENDGLNNLGDISNKGTGIFRSHPRVSGLVFWFGVRGRNGNG